MRQTQKTARSVRNNIRSLQKNYPDSNEINNTLSSELDRSVRLINYVATFFQIVSKRKSLETDFMSISEELKSKLVLIAEDNPILAEGMSLQFKTLGFKTVQTVGTLEECADLLENTTPGLAVLDFHLERGQTSRDLAETLLDQNVPVIFSSGSGLPDDLPPRLANLIVLIKPTSSAEFERAIVLLTS